MNLDEFKKEAINRGICSMLDDWNNAKSKKQLIDLALSARGLGYVARATAQGWGLDPNYIAEEFAPFNNGAYVRTLDGFTSALFCLPPEESIRITTTATLIIGFRGKVFVPRPCELYLVNSDVAVVGTYTTKVHLFKSSVVNDNCTVDVVENVDD